jgi:hypothetical protein
MIMKSVNKIWILLLVILCAGAGCKKYVDRDVLDELSDDDYWTSETNVRAFNWGFYDLFPGFGNGGSPGDFYFTSFSDDQVNPTFQNFALAVPASDANWDFSYIRKANLLLERIDRVPIDDASKNHWRGVARFFRAYKYFSLVKRFGDVPWIGHYLDISEDSVIYKPRDPRDLVMDSVLADLNFAVDNLREDDGENTVNKNVALALKSRICLYEGTYREYHENDNAGAAKYLNECKDASEKLMAAGYSLTADYQTVYNSMDLSGNQEVMLYKKYAASFLTHSVIAYTNASSPMNGLSKPAVESYLCTDGLPITLSALYQGDDNIEDVRKNRDKRLLETIDTFYCYTGARVQGLQSSTGYRPSKFLQPLSNQLLPYNETDAPLFWLAETLVNYAEAVAELDKLGQYSMTQADLDKSVNLLRARGGVAKLELSGHQQVAVNGTPFVDPKKDADVTSLIWEIRRERRTELMMDGFRFDDLMRWKKGDYMDSQKNPDIFLGAKVPDTASAAHNSEGYLTPYASTGSVRTFVDPKNYLSPIPSGQITLYPNGVLTQNPGWEQ